MPDSAGTKVDITEAVTTVDVTNATDVAVTLQDSTTTVTVNNYAVPSAYQDAANTVFTPYNTITATNVSDALKQLADQDFRGTSAPTGSTVSEGDTWYDTDDDQLKVYRETSSGTFAWVPIMVGNISADSDTIDAGSY
tara:strand:- start:2 stop:415 length:414 start_codon:yes stop_codon:yes gene_type:complete